ncbi:MAG: hypothetical protein VCA37_12275 [Roseibacillus sp.]
MIRRPACRLLAALSLTSIVGAANGPIDPTRIDHAVRRACVGDSITFGAGVKPRSTMAYPAQLGRMLGKKWEARNLGVSGATLVRNGDHPYHKAKACARAIAWKPDTVHPNAEGATVIGQTVSHALTGKSAAPKDPVLK